MKPTQNHASKLKHKIIINFHHDFNMKRVTCNLGMKSENNLTKALNSL
jgi:hypothetical protein